MTRLLAIKDADGEREVDLSLLSSKKIDKKLKSYQKKFGGFTKFLRSYDYESGSPEDYLTLIDWECLLHEQKNRKGARLSLVKGGSKKPR
jgi:hypothetical protein